MNPGSFSESRWNYEWFGSWNRPEKETKRKYKTQHNYMDCSKFIYKVKTPWCECLSKSTFDSHYISLIASLYWVTFPRLPFISKLVTCAFLFVRKIMINTHLIKTQCAAVVVKCSFLYICHILHHGSHCYVLKMYVSLSQNKTELSKVGKLD